GTGIRLLVRMEPKHSAEMSKHLDKQNQALMETYRAMSHELHKVQVEEETIMRKLYELMSAEGLLPKRKKESQAQKTGKSTQENKELEP
ncbi:Os03g0205150, partial [Oryza sativa Japonica Group]